MMTSSIRSENPKARSATGTNVMGGTPFMASMLDME